jgi:hypothetical protein
VLTLDAVATNPKEYSQRAVLFARMMARNKQEASAVIGPSERLTGSRQAASPRGAAGLAAATVEAGWPDEGEPVPFRSARPASRWAGVPDSSGPFTSGGTRHGRAFRLPPRRSSRTIAATSAATERA